MSNSLRLPLADGSEFVITDRAIVEWQADAAYQHVAVRDLMERLCRWARDNPEKRPNYAPAFLRSRLQAEAQKQGARRILPPAADRAAARALRAERGPQGYPCDPAIAHAAINECLAMLDRAPVTPS